ncbi:HSPG2 [Mytilus coruscus]|uniref:HSPG2 n=1 Tax=Mytilus coruscus TaxID=42192 RepID=A0A6J8BNT8_MYTCO|nr:HSPG2 [Mytilus coruscus]
MVPTPIDCQTVVQCGPNQECYARQYVTHAGIQLYDLGCIGKSMCSTTVGVLPSGFGKRYGYKTRLHKRQTSVLCTECCNTKDLCNMNGLCGSQNLTLPSGSTLCYNCNETRQIDDCREISLCNNKQACQVHSTKNAQGEVRWNHGCVPKQMCSISVGLLPSGFGKRNGYENSLHNRQATENCTECCDSKDLCNIDGLCGSQHQTPPSGYTLCYNCSDLRHTNDCQNISLCGNNQQCPDSSLPPESCQTCCTTDLCNVNCNELTPTSHMAYKSLQTTLTTKVTTEQTTRKSTTSVPWMKPIVQIHVNPTTTQYGSTVNITCDAMGIPTPNIDLLFKTSFGTPSNDKRQGSSIIISNFTSVNIGAYRCSTSNSLGRDQKTFHLQSLQSKPSIVMISIQPMICYFGDTVNVTCKATRHPRPNITYMVMTSFGTPSNDKVNGNSIIISNFTSENIGMYGCAASNTLGSDRRIFKVQPSRVKPSIVKVMIQPQIYQFGDTVNVTCIATENETKYILYGYGKDRKLNLSYMVMTSLSTPPNDKRQGSSIIISNFTSVNIGAYRCSTSNSLGSDQKTFQLQSLQSKPSIAMISIQPMICYFGDTVNVTCKATGHPRPNITYMVMTSFGTPSNDKVNGNSIIISNFTSENIGMYGCAASNTLGSDRRIFKVQPSQAKLPSNISIEINPTPVTYGSKINITCHASGEPDPNIDFQFKIKSNIPKNIISQGHTVIIANFSVANNGGYRCMASNLAGNASKLAGVEGPKIPPTIIEVLISPKTVHYNTTVTAQCITIGYLKPSIQLAFKGFVPANTVAGQDGITIHNFASSNNGVYLCEATNVLGTTTKIFEIHASFADYIGFTITKSNHSALQADGVTPLNIVGECHFTLSRDGIELQLEALEVNDLDVDILTGIHFMSSNDIAIFPSKHKIVIGDIVTFSYGSPNEELNSSNTRVRRTQLHRPFLSALLRQVQ